MSIINGKISPKTPPEILARLREAVHRHRKKFIKKHTACQPENCAGAQVGLDGDIQPCAFCGAHKGEPCRRDTAFLPRHDRNTLNALFKADINNPQKLVRDYRDVAFLLWALGLLDGDKLVGPSPTSVADSGEASHPSEEASSRIVWFELPPGVTREQFEVFLSALNALLPQKANPSRTPA